MIVIYFFYVVIFRTVFILVSIVSGRKIYIEMNNCDDNKSDIF